MTITIEERKIALEERNKKIASIVEDASKFEKFPFFANDTFQVGDTFTPFEGGEILLVEKVGLDTFYAVEI